MFFMFCISKLQLGYFGNADSYYNNAVCKFDGQNGKYFDRTQPPVVKSNSVSYVRYVAVGLYFQTGLFLPAVKQVSVNVLHA